jgi:hypothetical protein
VCRELSTARFIWKPHKTDEATEHITTQNQDMTNPGDGSALMRDALFASLDVPHSEHAFHGLVNHIRVSSALLHNGRICVSIRSPAKDRLEQLAEHSVIEDLRVSGIGHFAFVVDASGPHSSLALAALDSAAKALGGCLGEDTG